jgi:hypothetical protein
VFDVQARRRAGSGTPVPAKVSVDRAPGRIGFIMSTQRRVSRTYARIETDRAEVRPRRSNGGKTGTSRHWSAAGEPRITAPLMSIFWLAWVWLLSIDGSSVEAADREATNSLLLDHHNETVASTDSHHGSPPGSTEVTKARCRKSRYAAGVRGWSSLRITHRSSLRRSPILPVRAHLRTTLPIAPACEVRWAERHDGKRDLYFQHAA